MFRALRIDKLTYAALEATLLDYVRGDRNAIPALRMMRMTKDEVQHRARSLRERLPDIEVTLEDGDSVIGGGAAPSALLPTTLVSIRPKNLTATELAARLRASDPPVIARIEEDRVLLDLRTVFPEQDELVLEALHRATA
jgi:L-seryl-tRNA(Ser) seleniumtransferase